MSPPGSRPSSSYMLPSPRMQHDGFMHSSSSASPTHQLDPQNPPQFINPNATQISPPGSSAGHRSARASFSGFGAAPSMAPPLPAGLRKSHSVDMTFDMADLSAHSLAGGNHYMPKRSLYSPLSGVGAFPQLPTASAEIPMAQASRPLLESLEKRPLGPSGLPLNDRPVPPQLTEWRDRGGFWGRVASYYIQKHLNAATVYRSPFTVGATGWQGDDGTLAQRYYDSLEPHQRARIDDYVREAKGERF